MVTHHLGNDEGDDLLGELGIEVRLDGELTQPCDLFGLTGRICRRQSALGLEAAHLAGDPEPLGEQMDEGGVHVVNRAAQHDQFFGHFAHARRLASHPVRRDGVLIDGTVSESSARCAGTP